MARRRKGAMLKMTQLLDELYICAKEQGFLLNMEGKIWIPLHIFFRLDEIEQEDKA